MREEPKDKLAREICELLYKDPLGWVFDAYVAAYNKLEIWINNRPYADLRLMNAGEERIEGWFNRRKVRKALTWAKAEQARNLLRELT